MKEHKDSIQKLSLEYVRLQKENTELRKIIAAAKEALKDIEIITNEVDVEHSETKKKYGLSIGRYSGGNLVLHIILGPPAAQNGR